MDCGYTVLLFLPHLAGWLSLHLMRHIIPVFTDTNSVESSSINQWYGHYKDVLVSGGIERMQEVCKSAWRAKWCTGGKGKAFARMKAVAFRCGRLTREENVSRDEALSLMAAEWAAKKTYSGYADSIDIGKKNLSAAVTAITTVVQAVDTVPTKQQLVVGAGTRTASC